MAENKKKILQIKDLNNIRDNLKKKGKIIVATNGCFDLFHTGHLDSLNFASKQGDILFVGLNSDRSIRKLKGKYRPIITYGERAKLLSFIQCVDYVVEIILDPEKFYDTLRPDVLVKGSEYKNHKIIGSEAVIKSGGKIKFFERLNDISTSKIIKKIKDKSFN
jgi:D-beta-D-heptose 7-phosphate kinase/D-beta-D-heptose 1-phosphate adenosyltransferase